MSESGMGGAERTGAEKAGAHAGCGGADWPPRLRGMLLALGVVMVCTLVCFAMDPWFELANLVMVYLLGTMFIASREGLGPALLSSVLGVLAFDFFFVPPRFSVSVADSEYLFTLGTMFVVALVISRLTAHVRAQAEGARAREARAKLMLSLTRELAGARGADKLLGIATEQITRLYGFRALAILPDAARSQEKRIGDAHAAEDQDQCVEAVRRVLASNQPAGLGTGNPPACGTCFVPLAGVSGTLGVLAVRPEGRRAAFTPEQMNMIENLARQVGLMLEVEHLEGERQQAQSEAEAERLKTSLLSSVTHDLQTPLAVIMGSAESLGAVGEELGPEQRKRLADNIHDKASRLSRLLGNLLRMTKLQSGALKPDFQLQPIDEPLGTALSLMENQLAGRALAVDIPGNLPLAALDGMLMEQLFLNLLENVLKYTPAGSPVEIAARARGRELEIAVSDRGPGLAEAERAKVFDLFYQGGQNGEAEGQPGGRKGYGVGLTICRAIAHVHGGSIRAENRDGGGTVFRVSLPVPHGQEPAPDAGNETDATEGL